MASLAAFAVSDPSEIAPAIARHFDRVRSDVERIEPRAIRDLALSRLSEAAEAAAAMIEKWEG